jgi:fibronectin type 3 domain-containing protein
MKLKSFFKSLLITGFLAFVLSACGTDTVTSSDAGDGTPLVAPSSVSATQGTLEDSVLLNWDAVEGARYYVIYKAIETPESFKAIASAVTGLSYSDTPVSSGRTFYYRVAAARGSIWGAPSAEVMGFALKGAPMSPESVSIPVNEIGQITLNWDGVINADSYNVYRCNVKYGTYAKINAADITETSFTDTTVDPDVKYYYKVVPVNEYGEGAQSEIISGSALQQVPVWPGTPVLSATDATFGEKVRITWTEADYAASYTIMRAPDEGGFAGEYSMIAENVTGLVYEDKDTTIEDMTPYYYRVIALSSGGQSDSGLSETGSVDRSIPAELNPPTTVRASRGMTNVITITWSEVGGANGGYTIYRSTSSTFTSPVIVADKISPAVVEGNVAYDDTSMAPVSDRTTFFYKITAWSTSGVNEMESAMNATAAEGYANPDVPGVPGNLVSSMDYNAGTITVSWSAADSWTKRYTIYRSDNGIDGDYNLISENQTGTSMTEELAVNEGTIEAGVEYFYQVRAVNDIGSSALSDGRSATFTLRVPTNLAVDSSYNWDWYATYTYTVTWTAVKGATAYQVEYYRQDVWNVIDVAGGNTATLTFNSPNYGGGSYPVRIRAVNTTPDPVVYGGYSAQVQP